MSPISLTWNDRPEFVRIAVDQSTFKSPSANSLDTDQHKCLPAERRHLGHLLVQDHFRLIKLVARLALVHGLAFLLRDLEEDFN